MEETYLTRAQRAQVAMMLEVCAYPKPGNVDRCHDFPHTYLEHFLASIILAYPALVKAESGEGSIGSLMLEASILTSRHRGGNTHFGAFILLIPLIRGGDIKGADACIRKTTVEDAIAFYQAFAHLEVRVYENDTEFDIHDPETIQKLQNEKMTLFDVMSYSSTHDIVAREWMNSFTLTKTAADLLFRFENERDAVSRAFIHLLATIPDTFIAKKHGDAAAIQVQRMANEVLSNTISLTDLDTFCIENQFNPGSLADIMIAGIYCAIGDGWTWDV